MILKHTQIINAFHTKIIMPNYIYFNESRATMATILFNHSLDGACHRDYDGTHVHCCYI